jgi:hypothetical protein
MKEEYGGYNIAQAMKENKILGGFIKNKELIFKKRTILQIMEDPCTKLGIGKLSEIGLNRSWENLRKNGSMGSSSNTHTVIFVYEDGIDTAPIKIGIDESSNYAHSGSTYIPGENLEDALLRAHSQNEFPKFIFIHSTYYSGWEGQETTDEEHIEFYAIDKEAIKNIENNVKEKKEEINDTIRKVFEQYT